MKKGRQIGKRNAPPPMAGENEAPDGIEEWAMNYRPFYSLIRELANEKISRARFVLEWGLKQKELGLCTAGGRHE